jgi:hypothetical protein
MWRVGLAAVCVQLLRAPEPALADPLACERAIAAASARYLQGRAKAGQRCEDEKTKGPARTACDDVRKDCADAAAVPALARPAAQAT